MSYNIEMITANISFYENYSATLSALMRNIRQQTEKLIVDTGNLPEFQMDKAVAIDAEIDLLDSQYHKLGLIGKQNADRIFKLHVELQQAEAEALAEDEKAAAEKAAEKVRLPERTKLKWVSIENPETYRIAIVTNKGILQVKSVTDGGGECHEDKCPCAPCWEFHHNAPWRRRPLKKTFFATLNDWYKSLDFDDGFITTTQPN
jgi:hypothetical protein